MFQTHNPGGILLDDVEQSVSFPFFMLRRNTGERRILNLWREDFSMETITDLIKDVPIPKMVKIREVYDNSHIPEDKIAETVWRLLADRLSRA